MKAYEDLTYLKDKVLIMEDLERKLSNADEEKYDEAIEECAKSFNTKYVFLDGSMELSDVEAGDMEAMLDDYKEYKCSTWVDLSNVVIDKYIEVLKEYQE
jgi:hypothetical protein